MYQAAIARYLIPEHRRGVPALIIGDTVLIGVQEIPNQLPGIIEAGLASGGLDWPDIPGFSELIEEAESQESQKTAPNLKIFSSMCNPALVLPEYFPLGNQAESGELQAWVW